MTSANNLHNKKCRTILCWLQGLYCLSLPSLKTEICSLTSENYQNHLDNTKRWSNKYNAWMGVGGPGEIC